MKRSGKVELSGVQSVSHLWIISKVIWIDVKNYCIFMCIYVKILTCIYLKILVVQHFCSEQLRFILIFICCCIVVLFDVHQKLIFDGGKKRKKGLHNLVASWRCLPRSLIDISSLFFQMSFACGSKSSGGVGTGVICGKPG